MNSLGVLAGVKALDADVRAGAAALSAMRAMKGRGEQHAVSLPGGTFRLIDESYNASPAAMRAALKVLGATKPASGGRRIAVLGDMRELGTAAPELHAALAAEILAAGVDLVFTAGPLMGALHVALPKERRAGHAFEATGLAALVASAIRPGDVVLVKGSLGSRMGPIAEALKALQHDPPRPRAANGA
jgi:UDP-N-acetylmuramoyl-tripeptide--D-alanyl-D-alanine ligase